METISLRRKKSSWHHLLRDYFLLTLAMIIGALGWQFLLLPNHITMGGLTGISSIVYWGTGFPAQYVFFGLNIVLLSVALVVLGWRFCLKTIYAVVLFTIFATLIQDTAQSAHLLADQKFMATVVGGVLMGTSIGLGLASGGSTGGSDVIAAIVNHYRDISLGHVILICDLTIITSSYLVLHNWEEVFYGYVLLFILSFFVDYIVNSMRMSVQFFIVSTKWHEIGEAINHIAERGCTTLDGNGFYTNKELKVVFCIAKKTESHLIFDLIDEIDPNAFVAQSPCTGVYGQGFDRFKTHNKHLAKQIEDVKARTSEDAANQQPS